MSNPFSHRSASDAGSPLAGGGDAETTGKGDPAGFGQQNPYASPRESAGWPAARGYERFPPHRGGLILGLGISGVVISVIGFLLCAVLPVFALGLSIPAWVMGRNDLRAIDAGAMDPTGRGSTMAGMVMGIVGTVLGGLAALGTVAVLAFILAIFVGAAASS